MKKDLIIVPFHDYKKWIKEGYRTRDSHLFEHFKNNEMVEKILVVNRPVSLAEILLKHKNWKTPIGQVIYKENQFQLIQIEDNTYCIDFFSFDFLKVILQGKKWWYTAFNNEKVQESIRKAAQYIGMKNKVLFLENPMAVSIIGKLEEDEFVFDAIDNWLYHPQMIKNYNLIKSNYELIEEKADAIFTVSESLKQLFCKNPNVYWIPNGVDIHKFDRAIVTEKRKIPTIGYMGKIQDRVDFDLIEKIAKTYNQIRILIIGPIYSQKKKAKMIKKKYKNVVFMGDIHYDELPKEMQKIDIGIIPHKVDNFTNSMNPLKIYEYLAAGKQVVTTEIAGTNFSSDYVYIAKDDLEFVELIKKAIKNYENNSKISEDVRNTIKKEFLWEYKVKEILENI